MKNVSIPDEQPRPDTPRADAPDAEDKHRLTTLSGLAALSLDALSSVAYGPEAIVVGPGRGQDQPAQDKGGQD